MVPGILHEDKCPEVALDYDFLLRWAASLHLPLQTRKGSRALWYLVIGTCLDEWSVDEGLRTEA